MGYMFLSFTLDIWLIQHIIISLLYKPPSKPFPVWKSIQLLRICLFFKNKKVIFANYCRNYKEGDEEKHLSGFLGKWNSKKNYFLCWWTWCLLSIYNCGVRSSRRSSRAMGGRGVVTQITPCGRVAKRGTAESLLLCFQEPRSAEEGWIRRWWLPGSWHSPVSWWV